jgi:hypothetical protein
MKIKISVPEVVSLIKGLQENSSRIFEMATMNVQKDVGSYLTNLMKAKLTHMIGREKYERGKGESNHRNGSYGRGFCIKGDWRSGGKGSERSEGRISDAGITPWKAI